jgi:hypothetical protein
MAALLRRTGEEFGVKLSLEVRTMDAAALSTRWTTRLELTPGEKAQWTVAFKNSRDAVIASGGFDAALYAKILGKASSN